MLPRFDTGYWSLYSLGGPEAPLDYHQYVVRLLGILSKRTQDPTLATYAERFADDLHQPPVVKGGAAPGAIYPWPQDGYRDYARYVFWVSKRSTVRLQIDHAGSPVAVSRGWHSIFWSPGRIQPGTYTPDLHAVDVVGNASDTDLPPVEVRRDTQAPKVSATLAARRLYWRGSDDASPWLALKVVIRRPGAVRTLLLGKQTFPGSALLAAPRGACRPARAGPEACAGGDGSGRPQGRDRRDPPGRRRRRGGAVGRRRLPDADPLRGAARFQVEAAGGEPERDRRLPEHQLCGQA